MVWASASGAGSHQLTPALQIVCCFTSAPASSRSFTNYQTGLHRATFNCLTPPPPCVLLQFKLDDLLADDQHEQEQDKQQELPQRAYSRAVCLPFDLDQVPASVAAAVAAKAQGQGQEPPLPSFQEKVRLGLLPLSQCALEGGQARARERPVGLMRLRGVPGAFYQQDAAANACVPFDWHLACARLGGRRVCAGALFL